MSISFSSLKSLSVLISDSVAMPIVCAMFSLVTFTEERNRALQLLVGRVLPVNTSITTHLGSEWPFHSEDYRNIEGVVFRINLKETTGRFESYELSPSFTV